MSALRGLGLARKITGHSLPERRMNKGVSPSLFSALAFCNLFSPPVSHLKEGPVHTMIYHVCSTLLTIGFLACGPGACPASPMPDT